MEHVTRVAAATCLAAVVSALVAAPALAAPSFRSAASGSTGSGASSLTIAKPAGVVVGDVLVASIDVDAHVTAPLTPPTGWTLVRRDGTSSTSGTAFSQAVYVHVAGQLEPASYSWQLGSGRNAVGGIAAYSSVDTGAPVLAHSGRLDSNAKSITAPSISATGGSLVAGLYGATGVSPITTPVATSKRLERSSTSLTAALADRPHAGGPTGDLTASLDRTSHRVAGQLVALKPLAATSPPPPPPPPPPPASACPTLATAPPPGYCTGKVITVTPSTFGSGTIAAAPGDVVVFENGTYTDTNGDGIVMRIQASGTASKWITFVSRNKWGARIWGNGNRAAEGITLSGADYARVEGFEVSDVGNVGSPRGSSSGIDLYAGGYHAQIVGNHVHHVGRVCANALNTNGQVGIYIQSGKFGSVVVESNRIHDIGRFFVGENGCGSTSVSLDHGVYLNGSTGGGGGAGNVTIRNNVFYDTHHGWGIQLYPGSLSGIQILNNTFAVCNESKHYSCIVLDATISGSSITNNVFYNPQGGRTIEAVGFLGTITINKNLTSGSAIHDRSSTPTGMTLSGNLLNTDARLVSPATFDYHLRAGSPAIDVGAAVASVAADHDGTARPQGAGYDIGAYEFH